MVGQSWAASKLEGEGADPEIELPKRIYKTPKLQQAIWKKLEPGAPRKNPCFLAISNPCPAGGPAPAGEAQGNRFRSAAAPRGPIVATGGPFFAEGGFFHGPWARGKARPMGTGDPGIAESLGPIGARFSRGIPGHGPRWLGPLRPQDLIRLANEFRFAGRLEKQRGNWVATWPLRSIGWAPGAGKARAIIGNFPR